MGRYQHDCGCCPSGEAARARPADEKTKSRRECCCAAFWERCFDDLQVPNDDPDELWFNEPRDWLAHYPVFVSVSRLISLLSFGFGVVSNFFLKEELHRTFFPYLTRLNVLLGLLFYVLIYYREKRLYAHAVFASIYSLQKSGVKSRVDATIEQEEQEKDGGVYSSERRMASSWSQYSLDQARQWVAEVEEEANEGEDEDVENRDAGGPLGSRRSRESRLLSAGENTFTKTR